ncbi:MAG: hypothetical protein WAK67_01870, partial [Xanthobacteraceae bacterium]
IAGVLHCGRAYKDSESSIAKRKRRPVRAAVYVNCILSSWAEPGANLPQRSSAMQLPAFATIFPVFAGKLPVFTPV